MHRRAVVGLMATLALMAVSGRPAAAQSLTDLVSELFVFGQCGVPLCLDPDFEETGSFMTEHGRHYLRERVPRNDALILSFREGIGGVVGSLPPTAMAGGRIWSDGDRSASFGPIFAERAETLGLGRFFLGLQATAFQVTNFSGVPADNLVLNFFHEDSDVALGPDPGLGLPFFERDVLQVRTNLGLDYTVATAVLSAGLASFLDVGFSVPVVRASLSGTANAQILPLGNSLAHRFDGTPAAPVLHASKSVSGSATGIGDVSARMKINLTGGTTVGRAPPPVGMALLADVTFPTGQEEDLLGLGEGRGRALAILSFNQGRFSPHLNAGYLLREGNLRDSNFDRDAVLATVGFDAHASDAVTVGADLVTRWELADGEHPMPGPVTFIGRPVLTVESSSIPDAPRHFIDLAVGLKYMLGKDMILVTNALLPIQAAGLRPDVLWTLGLQGTFR
ncbi:transporter [Candidatus Palauibacter sp.]|uniref:transporter n=1 Tax=Candidatus Palauibacter sp. TaxID=3101350 RepID=UPI003B52C4AE